MLTSAMTRDTRLRKELTLSKPVVKGKSAAAKKVQEYLNVNGVKVGIDGDWGPATQTGLDRFFGQSVAAVNQTMMDQLAQPLLRAVDHIKARASINASIVAFAEQQLKEHPIEIGGANAGPWVRLYMDGNEGADWLWCAGFVTYIVRYCAQLHGVAPPVPRTFSCDTLANAAKTAGRFHKKGTLSPIPPGSIFLVPSAASSSDWIHTGLVLNHTGATFTTAEGNTDQAGSHNGFEAASRIRNASKVDIIKI